eukprot:359849-Chlamydomonas_euryale.AAC.6
MPQWKAHDHEHIDKPVACDEAGMQRQTLRQAHYTHQWRARDCEHGDRQVARANGGRAAANTAA